MSLRATLLLGLPLTLVAAAPFGYSLTKPSKAPAPTAEEKIVDQRKAGEKLCASRNVNERLKARVFDDAAVVGAGMSANLDLLASFSEVRMEQPLLKSRDAELGVTVCTGRFVLLLPPGAERGFGGMRLLSADVEYAALPAADGSGLVYQLRGADSIVYRLAAFNLRAIRKPEDIQLAAAEAPPPVEQPVAPLADPLPAPVAAPMPAPQPVQAAVPASPPKLAKAPEPAMPVETAKAEPKKAVVPKPVKPESKKAEAGTKLAKAEPPAAKKAKTAKADKPTPTGAKVRSAEAKTKPAKKEKLAAAAPKKPAPVKLAAKTVKVAAVALAKPTALKAKPRELAAARPKPAVAPVKPVPVAAGSTENSFLNYEKRKAAAPPKPIEVAAEAKPSKPVPIAAAQPRAEPCADASGAEERLVCANPGLKAKQRIVANTYFAALRDAEGETRRALAGSRTRFAAYVSRCASASCLASAYDDRVAEIRDIMAQY